MKNVLVTGGAGFLGSYLVPKLSEGGCAVRILDLEPAPAWVRDSGAEYVAADLRDLSAMASALRGIDTVIHAAFASGRAPEDRIQSVNVAGTQQLCSLAAAADVRRIVLISSTIADKPARRHPFGWGSGLNRLDAYRASRAAAERIVLGSSSPRLRTAAVRPKTFIGPGRLSAFTIVFDWVLRGQTVMLMGEGRCRYQLLEIGDMAEGIRLLAASDADGLFSFGATAYGTLREDLQSLLDYAQTGARIRCAPGALARAALTGMEWAGMVPLSELHRMSARGEDSVVDTSRAHRELGWQPKWSNREALRRAYDWYRSTVAAAGSAPAIHQLPGSHRMLRRILEMVLR